MSFCGQVMVFVHARNETVRTATLFNEMAQNKGHSQLFQAESSPKFGEAIKVVSWHQQWKQRGAAVQLFKLLVL